MRQCICQICVCGRHRCKHTKRRVPYAKDDDADLEITEHKERFIPYGIELRQAAIKPKDEGIWIGTEPTVKFSTAQKDYIPFPIHKRTSCRPKESTLSKAKYIGLNSTYKHDFIPKRPTPTEIVKHDSEGIGVLPGTYGKIAGNSTYKKCFTPKAAERPVKMLPKAGTLTVFGLPFTGATENQLNFVPHPLQRSEAAAKPKDNLYPEGDFYGNSTHKIDFYPKLINPARPIKRPPWKPGGDKFEGISTHKHDYICPDISKRIPCVPPKPSLEMFVGPFKGNTQYKADFIPLALSQRAVRKQIPYKPSDLPFRGNTTYRVDFVPLPEVPTELVKPRKSNLFVGTGPMEGITTFKKDFKPPINIHPRKSFRPDVTYVKPKDKFAGLTISGTDYTPKKIVKLKGFKGNDNLKLGTGPMDELSTNKHDFRWLAIECPATYIKLFGKDALPNYEFEKTEGGHDYFKRLKKNKPVKRIPIAKEQTLKKIPLDKFA